MSRLASQDRRARKPGCQLHRWIGPINEQEVDQLEGEKVDDKVDIKVDYKVDYKVDDKVDYKVDDKVDDKVYDMVEKGGQQSRRQGTVCDKTKTDYKTAG